MVLDDDATEDGVLEATEVVVLVEFSSPHISENMSAITSNSSFIA
jgi:hypothetical protein